MDPTIPPRPGYNHDWPTLQRLYIEGPDDLSLSILAQQHNVPFLSMEGRSRKETWSKLRAEFRQDVADRVHRESVKRHADMRLKLLEHQLALISAALTKLYDPQAKTIRGTVTLQDLDRMLTTYDRLLAREMGEDAPDTGTRINIAVMHGAVPGAQEGTAGVGLLALASRGGKPEVMP